MRVVLCVTTEYLYFVVFTLRRSVLYITLLDKRRDRGEKQTRKNKARVCEKLKRSVIKTWLSFVLYAQTGLRVLPTFISLAEVSPSRHIRGKFPKGNCLPNFADLEPLKLLSFAFETMQLFRFLFFFFTRAYTRAGMTRIAYRNWICGANPDVRNSRKRGRKGV